MKRLLLSGLSLAIFSLSYSQCDPDYDFGEAGFGVSPDPAIGESFNEGTLGMAYEDVVHILVPTDAGDVDSTFMGLGAVIDSLELNGVFVDIGELEPVPLSDIGLQEHCNNLGDSPNECTMMGGTQYCASIDGTPTLAGEFPLIISVTGYIVVFGQTQGIPVNFDQYTLIINDNPDNINEQNGITDVAQNVPNPFVGSTSISYQLQNAGTVWFKVSNLLGEVVYQEMIQGRKGKNDFSFDGSEMNPGIYLYSVEADGKKFTKRMVVGK
jgi:hypothetical protein